MEFTSSTNATVDGIDASSQPESESKFVRREPVFISDDWNISKEHFFVPSHYHPFVEHLLITKGTIVDRTEKLAFDISQDYAGTTVHLLCVLKGDHKLPLSPLLIDERYCCCDVGGSTFFKELCDALSRIHQCKLHHVSKYNNNLIHIGMGM